MTLVRGVDVSSVQGQISDAEWAATKASGVDFVIIKCSEGNKPPHQGGIDPFWRQNFSRATAAGLTVGLYHFTYILPVDEVNHPRRSPEDQATDAWAACGGAGASPGQILTFGDFEWPYQQDWAAKGVTPALCQDFICRWRDRYATLSGRRVGLYSFPYWIYVAQLKNCAELAAMPYWQAGPYVDTLPTSMPAPTAPWTSCDISQWNGGKSRLPDGQPVDGNICTPETFADLIL